MARHFSQTYLDRVLRLRAEYALAGCYKLRQAQHALEARHALKLARHARRRRRRLRRKSRVVALRLALA